MKVPGSFLFILFLVLSAHASAESYICDYNYMGAPTWRLEFSVDGEGRLSDYVQVTVYGMTSRLEKLTAEALGVGERIHAWISKEDPQKTIELITYNEAKTEGNSLLINSNVPMGKEMWGTCKVQ